MMDRDVINRIVHMLKLALLAAVVVAGIMGVFASLIWACIVENMWIMFWAAPCVGVTVLLGGLIWNWVDL